LAECGVDAEDTLLVAVHPADIDGPAGAGLRTAWINRTSGEYPAYFTAPDLSAASLPELAMEIT
jgi:2-haloacid dehalogenase